MRRMRERDQATVGAAALVILGLVTLVSYFSDDLPILGSGVTYEAYFAESAGLVPDDEVQLAGVKVGQVTSVSLDGNKVLVAFKVSDSKVGDATTASIGIRTLLGDKYIALQPKGTAAQDPGTTIPVSRTRTPFQLQDAFKQLSDTVGEIDTGQLERSFGTLSEAMRNTPKPLRDSLDGLSALSRTISSRDRQLAALLSNTSAISKTLADRNTQLRQVVNDGNLLLDEFQRRRDAIDGLLNGTRRLADQMTGLVADNRKQLAPALDKLGDVTDVLQRNQDNLQRSLALFAPFARLGTNATGNGRWFEGYICGLLPPEVNTPAGTFNPKGCSLPSSGPDQGVGGR